jgi:GNAT superfamily N-acetyltransferase
MSPTLRIDPLLDLPNGLDGLRVEAAGEGFRFVEKLVSEWHSGANRLAKPGEVFLGAFRAIDPIAVGDLNRDPYADKGGIGRLRHLYVRKSARRSGVGAALVWQLLAHAEGLFHAVRLRTETREAADFYVNLGFRSVQEDAASHAILLR